MKGVSGGEKKRCSIGVELITDPMLIFLDEPTTGLDSFTSTSVVQTMKNLARAGRTVVTTIHQPNSEIFEMFDRLMLMTMGKIIFFNEAKLSIDYFTKLGFPPPEFVNPADHLMEIMSIKVIDEDDERPLDKRPTPEELKAEYVERVKNFD